MGFDGYYLPNDNDIARDLIFGEDPVKKFNSAFPVELYLSESMDYSGEKEFFSKFGLEIKNHTKVVVSRRTFQQRVPQNSFQRPREGDLIYIPFLNGTGELYEITFTEQSKDMHMLGRKQPYFYELRLEKFKYSQEVVATGVDDIDHIVNDSSYMIKLNTTVGNGNNYITIIGGCRNTICDTDYTSIIGGYCNMLSGESDYSGVFSSSCAYIYDTQYSGIFAGCCNRITDGGGNSNGKSTIIGGASNHITNCSNKSSVLGGVNNYMNFSDNSVIIGGYGNRICENNYCYTGPYCAILCQSNASILGGYYNCIYRTSPYGSIPCYRVSL